MLRLCLLPTKAGVAGTLTDSHVTNTRSAPQPLQRGSSSGQSPTDDRPRRPNLRQLFLTCATRSGQKAMASPAEELGRPRDPAPPVTCKRQGAEGARFSGQHPASRARPAGTRGLGFQSSAQILSGSPQPALRRVRPYLTATRTELSSGAPHMPAASDSRVPGPLHRRTEAPLEPRRSRSGGWSCRGRSAHLRRTPAMLGD